MSARTAADVEELPKFVRWATAEEVGADWFVTDGEPFTAWAWFEPPVDWRIAGDGDDERRCSAMRCVSNNGPRPIAGVLNRWRWVRSYKQRRPALYAYCAEHMAAYGQYVVDGRVLWLRGFPDLSPDAARCLPGGAP